jgi:hypothetical protein
VDIGVETEDGSYIARPYTPLSTEAEYHRGFMRLLVKTYAQGKLTPLLAAKTVGAASLSRRPAALPARSSPIADATVFSSPAALTLALPRTCASFVGIFGGTGERDPPPPPASPSNTVPPL